MTLSIINQNGWHQGCGARDAIGLIVPYDSPTATSFCLFGALALAMKRLDRPITVIDLMATLKVKTLVDPIKWQDSACREKKDIVALLTSFL